MKTLKSKEWPERATIGRWFAILLMAAGMQPLVLPQLQAAAANQEITDRAITSAVNSDLHFDRLLEPYSLGVRGSEGIVTLSGSVDNLFVRRRAVKIAQSVRGVRGVTDQISVMPESRPDEDIRKDILTALFNDPAADSYQVKVTVKDEVVALTGNVGAWAQAQLAQYLAEGVRGVRDIRNDLLINYVDTRTDAEIASDVQATLDWDIWVHDYPIRAEVKDGQVTLSGTVGTVIQKFRANVDARVRGVESVQDSELKVDPAAPDKLQRRRKAAVPPAAGIREAVTAALRKDPRASRYGINVIVEDGVVILEGAVGYVKARTAAEQDAGDIVGVESVDNELTVRPEMNLPNDADAQKALRAALKWDPTLDGARIEAAVVNHAAYLSGSVEYAAQKAEAQDVAARIKGVIFVRNHLAAGPELRYFHSAEPYFYYGQPDYYETLGPPPLKSDADLKRDIERAFFWSAFVHRNDIKVTVDSGVVTLTGIVGTYLGFVEADRDARKSGAITVINRLKVL
jgi:osmotically-inducible protein OsmY